MNAPDNTLRSSDPGPSAPAKRRARFAGERAGAWLFAASFSVGIWGLALKVMAPSHTDGPPPSAGPAIAMLAPDPQGNGNAQVYWLVEPSADPSGYPMDGGSEVVTLSRLDLETTGNL